MNKISNELKDLIKKILVPVEERITIDEILDHPWMTGQTKSEPLKLDFGRIKSFSSYSRVIIFVIKQFKKVISAYIAAQVPQKNIYNLGND